MLPNNLFELPTDVPANELFQTLAQTPHLHIERIVSWGHTTPPQQWYDQATDEWVVLLQGEAQLLLDNEQGQIISLNAGDYLLLPRHQRHRVIFTSQQPPCIWLAIHAHNISP